MRIPFEPETYYHLYTHAVGRDSLFFGPYNYSYFMRLYRKHVRPIVCTHAYCLMPNHVHFLIEIRHEQDIKTFFERRNRRRKQWPSNNTLSNQISQQIGNCLNAYSKAYNKKYKRMGSLFCHAIRRKVVHDERYLHNLKRYIHYNPVHHGFVRRPEDWLYSSYNALSQPGTAGCSFENGAWLGK